MNQLRCKQDAAALDVIDVDERHRACRGQSFKQPDRQRFSHVDARFARSIEGDLGRDQHVADDSITDDGDLRSVAKVRG